MNSESQAERRSKVDLDRKDDHRTSSKRFRMKIFSFHDVEA
jgi:hypothetical protein